MTDTKTFLGIAWNYPPRFKGGGSSQPTEMVANEANIQQSIMTLLSTSPGEEYIVMNMVVPSGNTLLK